MYTINPITGRKIKRGGSTHRKLSQLTGGGLINANIKTLAGEAQVFELDSMEPIKQLIEQIVKEHKGVKKWDLSRTGSIDLIHNGITLNPDQSLSDYPEITFGKGNPILHIVERMKKQTKQQPQTKQNPQRTEKTSDLSYGRIDKIVSPFMPSGGRPVSSVEKYLSDNSEYIIAHHWRDMSMGNFEMVYATNMGTVIYESIRSRMRLIDESHVEAIVYKYPDIIASNVYERELQRYPQNNNLERRGQILLTVLYQDRKLSSGKTPATFIIRAAIKVKLPNTLIDVIKQHFDTHNQMRPSPNESDPSNMFARTAIYISETLLKGLETQQIRLDTQIGQKIEINDRYGLIDLQATPFTEFGFDSKNLTIPIQIKKYLHDDEYIVAIRHGVPHDREPQSAFLAAKGTLKSSIFVTNYGTVMYNFDDDVNKWFIIIGRSKLSPDIIDVIKYCFHIGMVSYVPYTPTRKPQYLAFLTVINNTDNLMMYTMSSSQISDYFSKIGIVAHRFHYGLPAWRGIEEPIDLYTLIQKISIMLHKLKK